ncbi:MAG: hypothetical protein JWP87_3135 [Labilithrix sp.]|jgi:hypothetical protein|nr:hypothetical protein [Labilithrix sp.]
MNPESTKNAGGAKEQQASREAAKKPARDDVHEQRQSSQDKEGVVKRDTRPPAQSLLDEERGDWEGMGQSRHQPEEPAAETKRGGTPTPGANSLAGSKG